MPPAFSSHGRRGFASPWRHASQSPQDAAHSGASLHMRRSLTNHRSIHTTSCLASLERMRKAANRHTAATARLSGRPPFDALRATRRDFPPRPHSTSSKADTGKRQHGRRGRAKRVQRVRGMADAWPQQVRAERRVEAALAAAAGARNYREVALPVVESVDLFARTLGEQSDVVGKEMYVFDDRSGNALALRPEGTAGAQQRAARAASAARDSPTRVSLAPQAWRAPCWRRGSSTSCRSASSTRAPCSATSARSAAGTASSGSSASSCSATRLRARTWRWWPARRRRSRGWACARAATSTRWATTTAATDTPPCCASTSRRRAPTGAAAGCPQTARRASRGAPRCASWTRRTRRTPPPSPPRR